MKDFFEKLWNTSVTVGQIITHAIIAAIIAVVLRLIVRLFKPVRRKED